MLKIPTAGSPLLPMEFDVMISYCWNKEKTIVKKIAEFLKGRSLKVWIDVNEIKGGEQLFDKIADGIMSSKVIVPCLSREYRQSENCKKELTFAVNQQKKILPLKFDNAQKSDSIDFLVSRELYLKFHDENGTILAGNELDNQMEKLYADILNLLKPEDRPVTTTALQRSEDAQEESIEDRYVGGSQSETTKGFDRQNEDELEKEIKFIENQALIELPNKYGAFRELNNSQLNLIGSWLQSFPYEKSINNSSKKIKLDLDTDDVLYICNAIHGGGNAAYTFFQIFRIRKADKNINYLKKILKKEKESFKNALNVLGKYNGNEMISTLNSSDITEMAKSATNISTDGGSLPFADWRFVAEKSNLGDVVDACQASRRYLGVDGSADAMFAIVNQRFSDKYKISDFLEAFSKAKATAFVDKVKGWIREKAEENIEERREEEEESEEEEEEEEEEKASKLREYTTESAENENGELNGAMYDLCIVREHRQSYFSNRLSSS